MRADFNEAFDYLIEDEGTEFTRAQNDSGGPTKFGVTQKAYSEFLGRHVDEKEIENLSIQDVQGFYLAKFWFPLSGDQLHKTKIAICLFDTAVLYGEVTAAIMAQKALSACGFFSLKFDGLIGDMTIVGLNTVIEDSFIEAFHSLILERIDSVIAEHPKNESFRIGWTNRANRLLTLKSSAPSNKEVT